MNFEPGNYYWAKANRGGDREIVQYGDDEEFHTNDSSTLNLDFYIIEGEVNPEPLPIERAPGWYWVQRYKTVWECAEYRPRFVDDTIWEVRGLRFDEEDTETWTIGPRILNPNDSADG